MLSRRSLGILGRCDRTLTTNKTIGLKAGSQAPLFSRAVHLSPIATRIHTTPFKRSSPKIETIISKRFGSTLTLPTSDAEAPPEGAADSSEIPPGYSVAHLYFDSVFPLTLGIFDPRGYISAFQGDAQLTNLKQVLPNQESIGFGFRIIGAESRSKDGGAFLTFAYKPEEQAMLPATLSVINARIRPHLRPIYQYPLSLARLLPESWLPKPSVHIVLGTPWLEDLARYPSRILSISFVEGGAPGEQQLWEILRPYGRVVNLEINAKDNKATATFHRMRSATSARNCLYGASVGNRKVVIDYVPPLHAHKLWDWLTNHPRIVLPILAFFLGTITYAVFDPIRAFFIKSNVGNVFTLSDYRLYAWLKKKTGDLFNSVNKDKDTSLDDWWERKAAVDEIQGWLRETPTTFITIAGPRGSGKHPLLERATDHPGLKHLTIHCEEIAHTAKGEDSALVPALANQVGYFPVFSWISSLNNLIDLAAVGLIGSKAGFSTPTDAQLKQVLNVTTAALANIKQETLRKKEKEAKRSTKGKPSATKEEDGKAKTTEKELIDPAAVRDGKVSTPTPALTATNSETAVRPKDDRGYDAPVVVLDGFHHKGLQSDLLWTTLAAWAADVVTSGTAHVVFVTDNPVAMAKTLGRALPNIPFQSITLADADEEKARGYVFSKLKELGRVGNAASIEGQKKGSEAVNEAKEKPSTITSLLTGSGTQTDSKPALPVQAKKEAEAESMDAETAKWVDLLGGRLTDLEALVQKVGLGYTVESAVKDIIARTVIEIRKNAFGDDLEDAKALPWSRGQAWLIVEKLANKGELPYYSLLHDGLKGDENALKAMEQAELISVRHIDGRPGFIRAGRPVILQALKELCRDRVFADTQRYLTNTSSIGSCEKLIREAETEMRELNDCFKVTGNFTRGNQAVRDRLEHLLNVLQVNQEKIQNLESANEKLSKSIAEERNLNKASL
ncbi:uncharacterized protein FA14DRAFT_146408 [Meira miltonrushii]|uniref:Mitochondrial escape protein 2 n=1 Tax=Meira miltonrushii TaxID=1280837 RepID=A0A316VIQ9_9BASI|nr:uncharacterized protein FA14DRAFT_146408 [Meira miltonrushii]PWN36183.1 hypothetical protein FA14DRAFT_146408 [Meira miltonrushii]